MFTYDEGKIIWIVLLTAVIFGLVKLNEWYYTERKQMTPDERRRADEDDHSSGDW